MNNIITHALLVMASAGVLLQQGIAGETRTDEQVLRISASTFEFKPSAVTVRKGRPVVLELVSMDAHHGFQLPEFHLRADVTPGHVEKLRFIPDKTGTFTFLCDVFCGDGHEEMSGTLNVIE